MHCKSSQITLIAVLAGFLAACGETAPAPDASGPEDRPNFVLILADDLGYTDLGAFGGEIETPNIDALAYSGLRLANFHMAPTCAPSRAMLLTGTDNHIAGLGTQENLITDKQSGMPGYEQHMTDRVVSVATLLREGGYRTYLSGKWHLGVTPETSPGKRGFERWFALLQGGGSHFDESGISPRDPVVVYQDQGVQVSLPSDFYSSDYFASTLMDMLAADVRREEPFFAFLSFTAPHWPLHAPDKLIEKYAEEYSDGYELLRQARIGRATELGLFQTGTPIAPPVDDLTPWNELTRDQRQVQERKMAVHAAMIDRLDWNVGRLIEFLESKGLRDNTVIIFLSDNGAEGHLLEEYPSFIPWLTENYDNRYENIGRQGSFSSLGAGWAHAANGPLRLFKGYLSEGGTRVPAIINQPDMPTAGKISHAYTTAMDFAPTLLELAGLERPDKTHLGRNVQEMYGSSFAGLFADHEREVHPATESISWELFGRRAVQRGRWKLAWLHEPLGTDEWELFDVSADPGETRDISTKYPAIRESMIADWERYAEDNGVILPEVLLRYPN